MATKNNSRRLRYGQAEEVQASSEGEMRGVGRTRPAGKARGKVMVERVSTKAKETPRDEGERGGAGPNGA